MLMSVVRVALPLPILRFCPPSFDLLRSLALKGSASSAQTDEIRSITQVKVWRTPCPKLGSRTAQVAHERAQARDSQNERLWKKTQRQVGHNGLSFKLVSAMPRGPKMCSWR